MVITIEQQERLRRPFRSPKKIKRQLVNALSLNRDRNCAKLEQGCNEEIRELMLKKNDL